MAVSSRNRMKPSSDCVLNIYRRWQYTMLAVFMFHNLRFCAEEGAHAVRVRGLSMMRYRSHSLP